MIADLKKLWQEAFHESEFFTNLFFTTGYAPERCHCITENGVSVSALYWFDCEVNGHKLAYIYGVATLKSHQGRGLAGQLMAEAHEILKSQGYAGAILVPAGEKLFDFYKKFGYEAATTRSWITCQAGDAPVQIREITPEEYILLLPAFQPASGVTPGEDMLRFLGGYCQFYAGDDFLLICENMEESFKAQELLGDTQAAPGILKALGLSQGRFRVPGKGGNFAMWLPLTENCPRPDWFGLALD